MKRLNNKILIIVLAALAGAFVLVKFVRSPKRESNIENAFAGIDTASITSIKIYPVIEEQQEIVLKREGSAWKASKGQLNAPVASYSARALLQSLSAISVQQLVSKKKDKWKDYNVSDSSGTHVILYKQQEAVADWWIGRSNSGSSTYIRTADADNVYAIAGLTDADVNKVFDDWRSKTFLRMGRSITSIAFQYPGDSSFVLTKKNKQWTINEAQADSLAVQRYLGAVSYKDLSAFADNFSPGGKQPDLVIQFKKDNNLLASVSGWKRENDWVFSSSLQADVYFSGADPSGVSELMAGKSDFLPAINSSK
jgi:hypothetical protein